MPHISLTLYKGRSKKEVKKMSQNIRQCLVETVGWKPSDISVSVEETESYEFASNVNKKIKTEKIIISSDYIK